MRLLRATAVSLAIVAASAWIWASAAIDPAYGGNEEANALYARDELGDALARYRALLATRPASAPLHVNAGNALYRLGDFQRALGEHELALTSAEARTKAVASYDRGNTLFRLGRFADARESYKDALRLDPGNRDAKYNLEVVDRLGRGLQQAGNGERPGGGDDTDLAQAGNQPGQQNPQGNPAAQRGQTGTDATGAGGDSQNAGNATQSLSRAVEDFRRNLTTEEALRLLEALRAQQRGIETLVEGRQIQRPGQEPLY